MGKTLVTADRFLSGRTVRLCTLLFVGAEDGHDIVDGHNEQLVIVLEFYRNGVLGMKQDFIVLPQRDIFIVFD
jgi:hypothetical protein